MWPRCGMGVMVSGGKCFPGAQPLCRVLQLTCFGVQASPLVPVSLGFDPRGEPSYTFP